MHGHFFNVSVEALLNMLARIGREQKILLMA